MFKKQKHKNYIFNRMHEITRDIQLEVVSSTSPDMDAIDHKRALLYKYRRRAKLINL